MKSAIITGVMAASILLAGCGKKNGSSDSSATPPKAQVDATSPASVTPPALPAQEIPKPPSDAALRQKVTGVWKYNGKLLDRTAEDKFTFAPNGNYAKQSVIIHGTERRNFTAFGTWQIKDGVLITTITKVDQIPQGAVGDDIRKGLASGAFINRHKIVSVNDHELVCEVDVYTITGTGGHSKTKGTMKLSR